MEKDEILFEDIPFQADEHFTVETLYELSNNKGNDEDE